MGQDQFDVENKSDILAVIINDISCLVFQN